MHGSSALWRMRRQKRVFLIILALVATVTLAPEILKTGENNLYALQAAAFLNGRLDLPLLHQDVTVYDGRYYVPFPPLPSLILLPFVALFGPGGTYPVIISLGLTWLNATVLLRILHRLGVAEESVTWLVVAFFFGTGYWYVLINSAGVWFFAHVVALTFMLLAIDEGLGRGRSWLAGLLVGLAFLTRQFNLFNSIFLLALLWNRAGEGNRAKKVSAVLQFGLLLGVCIALYCLFNWARFGDPLDTGYAYIQYEHFLQERIDRYGLFSLAYVPFNFAYLFLQGFHVRLTDLAQTRGPEMDPFGTSLTFASPFLFVAFWARWQRPLLLAAWASIALITGGLLLYFVNGWITVNAQRYTLDFFPVLMILVALGTQRVNGEWWKRAVVYSVVLNVIALVIVPLMARLLPTGAG